MIKTKTQKQLLDEGFRSNKNGYYIGEKKSEPALQISFYQWQHLLDRNYRVVSVSFTRHNEPYYKTECGETVPWFLIDGQLPDKSSLKFLTKTKMFGDAAVNICIPSRKISFDCSMRTMDWVTAKKVFAFLSSHFDKGGKK